MNNPIRSRWLLVLALACAMMGPASAQRGAGLQDAIEQVQRDTGGKILSAESVRQGRADVYRIKVLTREGRVQVVTVSAAGSGRDNDPKPAPRRVRPDESKPDN
jgi:hypothetical protein